MESSGADKYRELRQRYVDGLPARLEQITSLWDSLLHINWSAAQVAQLLQLAHKLSGSGATYQLPDISRHAALLEQTLTSLGKAVPDSDQREQLATTLRGLTRACADAAQSVAEPDAPPLLAETPVTTTRKQIALIEDDPDQSRLMQALLTSMNYSVHSFSSPDDYLAAAATTPVDLILLDISFPESPVRGITWMEEFKTTLAAQAPIIVMSARSDIVARIRALRAGAAAYLAKPINRDDIGVLIAQILERDAGVRRKVLWVDDDRELTAYFKLVLEHAGFVMESLHNPLALLQTLKKFQPDVIVLDYQMPECNGEEVARMLRQDPDFMAIPIIFVSASEQARARQANLSLVGSAFLQKPLSDEKLLTTLHNQISKSDAVAHLLRKVTRRQRETGLLNLAAFLSELDRKLMHGFADDLHSAHYLAHISLDRPDHLRNKYGHLETARKSDEFGNFLCRQTTLSMSVAAYGDLSWLVHARAPANIDRDELFGQLLTAARSLEYSDNKQELISVSIGAMPLLAPTTLDKALKQLEHAHAQAVTRGGNQVSWDQSEQAAQSRSLDARTKTLLQEKSFRLDYQPIVNLESGDAMVESLVRLSDDNGPDILPAQFFPWVESELDGGFYTLDRWVLEHALGAVAQAEKQRGDILCAAIKLSSPVAELSRLLPFLGTLVAPLRDKSRLRVLIALPEDIVLRHTDVIAGFAARLQQLGIGLMIDRASGGAQTATLTRLPALRFIKLDAGLCNSVIKPRDIPEALRQFAGKLPPGVALIATALEDAARVGLFWELGIRHFQGYFIAEPERSLG